MFMGSHSFSLSAFVSHFSSCLGSDETSVPVLASGKSPWVALKQSVKGLSVEFSLLSEKAAEQVTAAHMHRMNHLHAVLQELNLFI